MSVKVAKDVGSTSEVKGMKEDIMHGRAVDDLVPSDDVILEHAGGMTREQFVAGGDSVVHEALIQAGGLKPTDALLDVGCGCGRIARPLTRYLAPAGRYEGFDIRRSVIDWCRDAYAGHPNFHFHFADIVSTRYNADSGRPSAEFRFPFGDEEFDFIFLGSVFTHMLPDGVAHYLTEIARVMRPGGKCLATFFLLDEVSSRNNAAGVTDPRFVQELASGCWVQVPHIPEAAVAYPDRLMRELYARSGLAITLIGRGQWGRETLQPHAQDAVWSMRPRAVPRDRPR
jgi:SAM-dependent methyltransferase